MEQGRTTFSLERNAALPLPLSIVGLRALIGEAIVAGIEARITESPRVPIEEMIEYAGKRLPGAYGENATTRGPSIGAIEDAEERGYQAVGMHEGATLPPDPEWLINEVNDILYPLLESFGMMGVFVPGAVAYLERKQRARDVHRGLFTNIADNGSHQARTDWFRDPDTGEQLQLRMDRRQQKVSLTMRKKGEEDFYPVSVFRLSFAPHMARLWSWLHDSFSNPL